MRYGQMPTTVDIVYFSGTGSTKRVADELAIQLEKKKIMVKIKELHHSIKITEEPCDMLILCYPVYALNAPKPIYEYIDRLPKTTHTITVVLSVSGGGEVSPNTASRLHCIKRLQKKGFVIPYETMLVMPSNFLMKTPNQLTAKLFELLPIKIEQIVDDILSGVRERSNPKRIDHLLSTFGEIEKLQIVSWIFGKHIKPNHNCNGCGLCASSCPRGNILMVNQFPKVGAQCVFCLRCIYGCKRNALRPHVGRFIVIKDGYNIGQLEKVKKVSTSVPKEYRKRYAYSGIIKYIMEVEEIHKKNDLDRLDSSKRLI